MVKKPSRHFAGSPTPRARKATLTYRRQATDQRLGAVTEV